MSTPETQVKAAVVAEVTSLKTRVKAFIAAHYSKVVSAVAGWGVAKLGIISLILKAF